MKSRADFIAGWIHGSYITTRNSRTQALGKRKRLAVVAASRSNLQLLCLRKLPVSATVATATMGSAATVATATAVEPAPSTAAETSSAMEATRATAEAAAY